MWLQEALLMHYLTWFGNPENLYESGKGCNADQSLITLSWACGIRYFRTKLFLTYWRPLYMTFTSKSYLRRGTKIAYTFKHCTRKRGFFRGEHLFGRWKRHARFAVDLFFLHIKSCCKRTLGIWGFRGHFWPNTFST